MFQRSSSGYAKLAVSWLGGLAILFVPFRPANAEPVLGTLMPVSKRFGSLASLLFAFLSVAAHDLCTSGIGTWTYITAFSYGIVGIASSFYFKNRAATRWNFLKFGVGGTIAYDALTGLTIGPIFYHQPFMTALVGQIPFTAEHMLGTAAFALLLSPLLYRWYENEEIFVPFGALVRSRT